MPYARNQNYNTRNSNRGGYNTPGKFVAAAAEPPQQGPQQVKPVNKGYSTTTYDPVFPSQQGVNFNKVQDDDIDMRTFTNQGNPEVKNESTEDGSQKLPWKPKSGIIRKVSMKERRRRQNATLRRLLTPKKALMVLNEMLPGVQVNSLFTVEAIPAVGYSSQQNNYSAEFKLDGQVYKGFGENKNTARNAAAEQAIRDIILKKMNNSMEDEVKQEMIENRELDQTTESTEENSCDSLPMMQLASFALYKLFSEWECEGHRVPTLRPAPPATSAPQTEDGAPAAPAAPRPPRPLPLNAARMHPSMLLTYMNAQATYSDGAAPPGRQGVRLVVDGVTFTADGHNKREARRSAAAAAARQLWGVEFEQGASESVPIVAAAPALSAVQ